MLRVSMASWGCAVPRKPTAFRLPEELLARVDERVAAGWAKTRTEFLEIALEQACAQNGGVAGAEQGDGAALDLHPVAKGRSTQPPTRPPAGSQAEKLERAKAAAPVRPAASWLRPSSPSLDRFK